MGVSSIRTLNVSNPLRLQVVLKLDTCCGGEVKWITWNRT